MKPLIFDRVVETNVNGNIPPHEYETTYIFQKIQLSYLSKFIRWIEKTWKGYNYCPIKWK